MTLQGVIPMRALTLLFVLLLVLVCGLVACGKKDDEQTTAVPVAPISERTSAQAADEPVHAADTGSPNASRFVGRWVLVIPGGAGVPGSTHVYEIRPDGTATFSIDTEHDEGFPRVFAAAPVSEYTWEATGDQLRLPPLRTDDQLEGADASGDSQGDYILTLSADGTALELREEDVTLTFVRSKAPGRNED
jgi:hypothetical protein